MTLRMRLLALASVFNDPSIPSLRMSRMEALSSQNQRGVSIPLRSIHIPLDIPTQSLGDEDNLNVNPDSELEIPVDKSDDK